MSINTRIYKVENLKSLHEALNIISLIRSKFITVDHPCLFKFQLSDLSKYTSIASNYNMVNQKIYSVNFECNALNDLTQLIESKIEYDRIIVSSQAKSDSLGYWVAFTNDPFQVIIDIYFPNKINPESYKDLNKILRSLIKQNLIFIIESEIDQIIDNLIKLSEDEFNGSFSYKDRFEICVNRRFGRLKFEEDYKRKSEINPKIWISKMLTAINEAILADGFSGFYYPSNDGSFLHSIFNHININMSTNVAITLEKDINITELIEIADPNKEIILEMANFNWPNYSDKNGRISLSISNNEFSVGIYIHQNEDQMKSEIEKAINHTLVVEDWI